MVKRIFLILLLNIIAAPYLEGQANKRTKAFLEDIFKEKSKSQHIYYGENISSNVINSMKISLKKDTLTSWYANPSKSEKKRCELVLTPKEKRYLLKEINKQVKLCWPNQLIANSSIVADDTLSAYESKLSDFIFLKERFDGELISFSHPIFIRRGTVCFFYNDSYCGPTCGGGDFSIYIKERGRWVLIITLFEWIS